MLRLFPFRFSHCNPLANEHPIHACCAEAAHPVAFFLPQANVMWTTIFFVIGGFALGAYAMRVYTNMEEKKKLEGEMKNPVLTPTVAGANFQGP